MTNGYMLCYTDIKLQIEQTNGYYGGLRVNRLKQARLEKGVMQKDLAKAVGVSHPFIHDLENNKRNAKPETWAKIAAALGCTVKELKGDPNENFDAVQYQLDILNRQLINARDLAVKGVYTPREYRRMKLRLERKMNAINAENLESVSNLRV